jgi:hypothetical protein
VKIILAFTFYMLSTLAFGLPTFVEKHFDVNAKQDTHIVGEITEVEMADPYVYLQVKTETGGELVWVATNKFDAKKGLMVRFQPGKQSEDFRSPTTGKVYSKIYLVSEIEVARATAASGHDDCFLVKSFKDGDKVELTGLVTKVNVGILSKNWIHLQDKQGRCLSLDLTVTSQAEPKVGSLVKATGVLRFDQTIGGAYHFPVLIEEAEVSVVAEN